jgi:hypothetical protein
MVKRKRTDNAMVKRRRTDNTMVKRRRTDNVMVKRRRTDNTMVKRRRTDNTMVKRRRTDNTMVKTKRTKVQRSTQNTTHKNKDRVTQISLNTGVNSCAPEGLAVPGTHMVHKLVISNEWGKNRTLAFRQIFWPSFKKTLFSAYHNS